MRAVGAGWWDGDAGLCRGCWAVGAGWKGIDVEGLGGEDWIYDEETAIARGHWDDGAWW